MGNRFYNIPENLKQAGLFCLWRYELKIQKGEKKLTKVPYQINGRRASASNPSTFSTFDKVMAAYKKGSYDGIGVLISTDLIGIDVDHCINAYGKYNSLASEFLKNFDTYAEKSPSGNGIHILAKFKDLGYKNAEEFKAKYCNKLTNTGIPDTVLEIYPGRYSPRYFTITGDVIHNDAVKDCSDAAIKALDKYMKKAPQEQIKAQRRPIVPISITDQELINKAMDAPNGADFRSLWNDNGIWEQEHKFSSGVDSSHSGGDINLAIRLIYWAQGDRARVENLFDQSPRGLSDKWKNRPDYRKRTLDAAFKKYSGPYYEPKQKKQKGVNKMTQLNNSKGDNITVQGRTYIKKPELTPELFMEWLKNECPYTFKFNKITHETIFGGFDEGDHSFDSVVAPTYLASELKKYFKSCSKMQAIDFIDVALRKNAVNPLLDEIEATKWDGQDHFKQLYDLLKLKDEFEITILRKWLKQAIALLHNGDNDELFAPEFVLVFQGNQGVGKTNLMRHLVPHPKLYFKEGETIDTKNKDCLMRITSAWITELGEIGSTTKKDVDSLKAHITKPYDEYRAPYTRTRVFYPRHTSYYGTVNENEFLVDPTGNRRFVVIKLPNSLLLTDEEIEKINSLQLWAQINHIIKESGQKWDKCFRLSIDENIENNKRNLAFTKPLYGEDEVKDILEEIKNTIYEEKSITVSQFCENNPRLKKFNSRQVGKVFTKLGYTEERKENGRFRKLPVRCFG